MDVPETEMASNSDCENVLSNTPPPEVIGKALNLNKEKGKVAEEEIIQVSTLTDFFHFNVPPFLP